ncbi:MAG: hypothetical protein NXI04_24795 [Planctomycetaceae bacterium]|nr:hypothetical protein [Planctomycetaceae bacterium]
MPNRSVLSLRRVGILSVAMFAGTAAAAMALIFALMLMMFAGVGLAGGNALTPAGVGAGVGFVVFAPIMYGIMGFIGGAVNAVIYNVIAEITGGIRMEFDNPDHRR